MKIESDDRNRMVRKKEAAARLGVSTRTIEREVSSGRLKKHKIRGCVCFSLGDVLKLGGFGGNVRSEMI